ncbi:TraB/GumN family protein [Sphingomonas sp. PB4P5]|uniref:TraB/GumN family protein n=1 Tax=Parasphingomonas puruogangriensis TaxID=3096155 RepID=UPI002FCACFCD
MIRWLALAAALLLASCGPRETVATPAVWRLSDGDTEIWLLGTIHALPAGVHWQTPAVAAAIAGADTLVTEIPAGDAATFEAAARVLGLPPLAQRVAAAQRAALARYGTTLDDMKTWAAAVTIAAAPMQQAGASAEDGVDATLAARFAGRRHLALETQAGQLALFDSLPEPAQRVLLARAIGDPDGYARTLAAWSAGDMRALAASLEPAFRGTPVLQEVLVTRRNARWSGWIAQRMRRPGRVLVAVGAGHLVGADSVVAMLGKRGFTVTRIG